MKKKDNREPVLTMSHWVSCSQKLWVSLTWTIDYDHFYLPRNEEIPSCIPIISSAENRTPSHWRRIWYKWLMCYVLKSVLWSTTATPTVQRTSCSVPWTHNWRYWTVNCRAHKLINPLMKMMDNQIYELSMSCRVSFSLKDKPPSFWWTNGQWATISFSLNE